MKDNIDIFIGTHKAFTPPVSNPAYKIIVGNHDIENSSNLELIKCKHDEPLDDRFYSEIYMFKYLIKNRELKDYVGFCHYRKYFIFMDNIPDMDEVFSTNDVVIGKPIKLPFGVSVSYALAHNIDDLIIAGRVIKQKHPEYLETFLEVLKSKRMIPYNMFIMRREDFIKYVEFVSSVLDGYVEAVGTDIEKRITDNKEKYLKKFEPNSTVEYQYRIGGYLAERLTNAFMLKNFKNARFYGITITEKKYNSKLWI